MITSARRFIDRCTVAGQTATVETSSEEIRATLRYILQGFSPNGVRSDAPPPAYGLALDGSTWTVTAPATSPHRTEDRLTAFSTLEWQIVRDALARRDDLFQLHGAALCHPLQRAAIVIAGGSHHGKTTLALSLLSRGFLPYGDDTVLIEPDTLEVQPFPRAFHVSDHTWELVLAQWGVQLTPPATPLAEYFSPPQWAARPAPVRWMFFPEIGGRATPSVQRLPPAEVASTLLRHTSTLDATPRMALGTISHLTARAECYRLFTGDVAATLTLIAQVVTGRS